MALNFNLGRYILRPFVVLSTGNVDISTAPASINDVVLASGDRVFLIGQSTATQNGGYVFNGAGSAMTRTTDLAAGAVIKSGTIFNVLLGKPHKQICFEIYASSDEKSDITIGTTAFTYRFLNDGKISYAGYIPAASGLQADATELLSAHNVVLLGADNYSAKVPLNSAFQFLIVNNLRAFTLKLFPSSGGNLGAGVDTAITLQPYEIIYLYGIGNIGSGQQWVPFNPVSNAITNGVKHRSPSEDAVFDALALKGTRYTKFFQWSALASPLDNTVYYIGNISSLSLGSPSAGAIRNMFFGANGTLKEVYFTTVVTNTPTNELVTMYLHNLTTATDYLIGTFNLNIGASNLDSFLFTGLDIAVNNTDDYTLKILTPTWATNPSQWFGAGEMYIL